MKNVTRSSASEVTLGKDGKPTVVHKKPIPTPKSISTGSPKVNVKHGAAVSGVAKSTNEGLKKAAQQLSRPSTKKKS